MLRWAGPLRRGGPAFLSVIALLALVPPAGAQSPPPIPSAPASEPESDLEPSAPRPVEVEEITVIGTRSDATDIQSEAQAITLRFELLDEWLARVMVHYRWHYDENTRHVVSHILGRAVSVDEARESPLAQWGPRACRATGTQSPHQQQAAEREYGELLAALETQLAQTGYALGERPTAVDAILLRRPARSHELRPRTGSGRLSARARLGREGGGSLGREGHPRAVSREHALRRARARDRPGPLRSLRPRQRARWPRARRHSRSRPTASRSATWHAPTPSSPAACSRRASETAWSPTSAPP